MIALTTPYDPGSLDPGKSYTHAKMALLKWTTALGRLYVVYRRGHLKEGEFIEGLAPELPFNLADTEYETVHERVTADGVKAGLAIHLSLDQWMIDKKYLEGEAVS